MNINDFAVLISKKEGGKVNLSIAQIKEVLKKVNIELDSGFYKLIRKK